ncbi:MAG TPA: hypothetical protein VF230_03710 [Acidimicrobiales bacterium]
MRGRTDRADTRSHFQPMRRSKTLTAAALAAGGLLLATGAAALELPDSASDVADEKVADVVTGQPENPQATADDHRKNDDAGDTADVATDETDGDVEADGEGQENRPTDTHGYEVSQFVHETELEGQAKGAAVSELAKSWGEAQQADHAPAGDDAGDTADAPADAAGHGKSAEARAGRG